MKQKRLFFFFLVTGPFPFYENKKFSGFCKKKNKNIKIDFGIIIRFFFVLFKADVTGRAEFSRRHHNHFLFFFFSRDFKRESSRDFVFFVGPHQKKKNTCPDIP
jgi:hypothetical protein